MKRLSKGMAIVIAAGCAAIVFVHLIPCRPSGARPAITLALGETCGEWALPLAAFGPDGKLYVACRPTASGRVSANIVVAVADPSTGKLLTKGIFAVPSVELPRRLDALTVSPDGQFLVYAELHEPKTILTIRIPSLQQLGGASSADWTARYGDLKMVGIDPEGKSVFIAAADRDLKLGWHLVELDPYAPTKIRSDRVMPFHENTSTFAVDLRSMAVWWINHLEATEYGLGPDKKLRTVNLGTNLWFIQKLLFSKSSIVAFSSPGPGSDVGRIDLLANADRLASTARTKCSVENADLTFDGDYLVALCETVGKFEPHFGEVFSREACIFRTRGLEPLATLPVSRMNLHEPASSADVPWTAWPVPAVWHGRADVVVAIPTFGGNVELFSLAVATPAATATTSPN